MRLNFYLILVQFTIFYNQYDSVVAKAMIGSNIRHANQGEFNFIVSFKRINNQNSRPEFDHECTGSLITKKDIITTAHPFTLVPLNNLEVIVGSVDLRNGRKYYPAWWINYSQWAIYNYIPIDLEVKDIAIIRLTQSVHEGINPVAIYPISPTDLFGSDIQIAGWGSTRNGEISRFMETTTLKVLQKNECENRLNRLAGRKGYVPENLICSVADPYAVATPGNSGAPILFMGLLVAIHKGVSSNLPDFHPDQVNIHLSIKDFAYFIENVLNIP